MWAISSTQNIWKYVNVRMRWYINYYQRGSYITPQIGVIYGHAIMDMRKQRQNNRNMGYGGVTNGTFRSNQPITTTAATHAQSCRLLLLGGWIAVGRQDRSVVLCAKIGKCTCTLYEQKNPVCIQILCAYMGIVAETQSSGGCVNPIPGGMRKPNPRRDA